MIQLNLVRGILGSVVVILCFLLISTIGCNNCKDVVLSQLRSPGGKWVATQMTRDCGGLGGEYVGVSIHGPSDVPTRPEDSVFMVKVRGPIVVSWRGDERVVIKCDCPDSNIKEKRTRLRSIEINYETR